ncbi:hypothetical protein JD969_14550 [Planctomycetota bacterium]|nr:hypothetical protein JD969_14550 [Planctomycetota bacterium]
MVIINASDLSGAWMMSKWVYVIAAVGEDMRKSFESIDESNGVAKRTAFVFEELIQMNGGDSFSYFASFMDGWARTHDDELFWNEDADDDEMGTLWEEFVRDDILIVNDTKDLNRIDRLVKSVMYRELDSMNAYAIKMFCRAICDSIQFALKCKASLVVSCQCVGRTKSDEEY